MLAVAITLTTIKGHLAEVNLIMGIVLIKPLK
jgi:hypothetical protein